MVLVVSTKKLPVPLLQITLEGTIMAKLRIFKATHSALQYIFHGMNDDGKPTGIAGKAAVFLSGEYRTKVAEEIAELDKEIRLGHPLIFVDKTRYDMEEEDLDPAVALRKRYFAEFQAEQERANNAGKNTSESDPTKSGAGTGVMTTAGAGAAAASSNSPAGAPATVNTMAARLANLTVQK